VRPLAIGLWHEAADRRSAPRRRATLIRMRLARLFGATAKEPPVAIGDPRFDGWETVGTFEDQSTAVAWRDQLRGLGVDAACVADHPLDRHGLGDVYLVVAPGQWSRANEILENLD
jgi:hypothetical protein